MKDVTPKHAKATSNTKVASIVSFFTKLSQHLGWSLYAILGLAIAIYYYVVLPPIHYASMDFWIFLSLIVGGILAIEMVRDGRKLVTDQSDFKSLFKKRGIKYKVLIGFFPVIGLVWLLSSIVFTPLFMAKPHSQMIQITQADFQEDFPEVDVKQIPLIDRDTAIRLGNRRLGALTDLVSQFVASDEYVQININNYPYRVTPLEYAGFFKWINNFNQGIPHYLKVDNVTGDVTVETPESPIRYSYADKFDRNILRHLRFNYPFTIFGQPNFEVDDQGVPHYIASTYRRHFFLFEPEVDGLIIVNALTGEHQYFQLGQIPTWVDRVYGSDLILHQIKMNGKYQNGFWNTVFSNQGVTQPTEGYNYLPMEDDLYLYTGITSIVADESNIGFVLVNMRTKEAKMYPLTAAEEFSAMSSAEGSVQETGYTATFPLLINLSGRPMYILSLKDASGLIKDYALVDVQNYQTVYVEPSVDKLLLAYANDNPAAIDQVEELESLDRVVGQVDNIQAVVKDGNTVYYFMIDGTIYQAPIQLNDGLPFLQYGQEVQLEINGSGQVKSIQWDME